jgi:rhamnosyltransferase subunit B
LSRFVLATLGSLGDLHPYLTLGVALRNRGHQVCIATSRYWQARVERLNLDFAPVRPDLAQAMHSTPEVSHCAHRRADGTEYVLKRLVLPFVDDTYDDLLRAFQGADLAVNHAVLFATPLAAEKLRIPWISVILSPGIFLSAYDPPLLPPLAWFRALHHLGPFPHRALYRVIDRITGRWMTPVHELRSRLGLPRARTNPVVAGLFSPWGTLALFSSVVASPQADWPPATALTGFVFHDEPSQAPDSVLLDFLDRGDPPVVFTLGSDAVTDAGPFYRESLQAVRDMGWRAVFLTGEDPRNRLPEDLPNRICVRTYVDYAALFPRARAVVHSGGIGTIAETLRAGRPMLVVPFAADQFDNGARVKRQGFGLCLWRERYNAARARALLGTVLRDPQFERRTLTAQRHILGEDGVSRACALLEKAASGSTANSEGLS